MPETTTSSIEAYRDYAEGINLHERFREAEAATLFEKAIAIDPSFAMAYVKLAVVHGNLGHLDQQTRIRVALEPFMSNPRFRYRDFMYIFGGKHDKAWFNDLMWLNPSGNKVLAEKMSEPVMELIEAMPK